MYSWFYCSWSPSELLVEGNFGTWSNSWSDLIWDLWEREVLFQSTEICSVVRYFHCLQHRFKSWYSSLGVNTKVFFLGLKHWVQPWNSHLHFKSAGKNVLKIHWRTWNGKRVKYLCYSSKTPAVQESNPAKMLKHKPLAAGRAYRAWMFSGLAQRNYFDIREWQFPMVVWAWIPAAPPPHPAKALWFVSNTSSSCCHAPDAHPSWLHHQGPRSAYLWTWRIVSKNFLSADWYLNT